MQSTPVVVSEKSSKSGSGAEMVHRATGSASTPADRGGAKSGAGSASASAGRLLVALVLLLSMPLAVFGATTPNWGIPVYVKADTAGIRQVSAAQGTFIWEGTITYAWRDDSMSKVDPNTGIKSLPVDGSTYTPAYGCSSLYLGNNAAWTGAKYTPNIGFTQCNTKPEGPYPLVTPEFPKQTASSKNSITWTVNFGNGGDVPDFLQKTSTTKTGVSLPEVLTGNTYTDAIWVVGVQKVSVTILNPQDLHNFPIDTQTVSLTVVNTFVDANATKFQFIDDEKSFITSTSGDPDNQAYIIQGIPTFTVGTDESTGGSSFTLSFVLKRNPDLYFIRFILPLTIITAVVLGWMFAPPGNGSRTNGPFTIIATTTSFIFIASNSVPQIPYRTRLDNYFIFQFLLASCVGVWNIYSANRMDRFKSHYAKKISEEAKKKEEKLKKKQSEKLKKEDSIVDDKLPAAATDAVALQLDDLPSPEFKAVNPEDVEPKEEIPKLLWKILKFQKAQEKEKAEKDKAAAEKAAASSKTDTLVNEAHYMGDVSVAALFVAVYVILVAVIFASPTLP